MEDGEGRERETWPRIFFGEGCEGGLLLLIVVVLATSLSSSATHAASVEGEERNSTAWVTPWTG